MIDLNTIGFGLQRDYLTKEEEKNAVAFCQGELTRFGKKEPDGKDGRNRLARFGHGYEDHFWVREIPGWLLTMGGRIVSVLQNDLDRPQPKLDTVFDSITINEFGPGRRLWPHTDDPVRFDNLIALLSLGGDVTHVLSHPEHGEYDVEVQRRSLITLQDDARYKWQHGTKPVIVTALTNPRYSIVFRMLKK